MKIYKRLLFLIVILTLIAGTGLSGLAAASQQIVFDSARVGLWPERTGQSVFVSLDLMLSSNVSLPQELTIQIPATAMIGSLRGVDDRGSVHLLDWEETEGELWKFVQFTTPSSNILIEYTDPTLVIFDQLRTYNYTWLSSYQVNNLAISVRQPYGAGDLVTHPEADVVEGCCTYILNAGMARAGTDFNVTFHYVKDLQNTEFEALVVSR